MKERTNKVIHAKPILIRLRAEDAFPLSLCEPRLRTEALTKIKGIPNKIQEINENSTTSLKRFI